jgi:hypothetical protein
MYQSIQGKKQVQIHGVVWKNGCAVPECLLEEFQKNSKEADEVRGTLKAALMEGDPFCPSKSAVFPTMMQRTSTL